MSRHKNTVNTAVAALVLSAFHCVAASGGPPAADDGSRAAFVGRLARVTVGMPASQVRALVGAPDAMDHIHARYPLTTDTYVWLYGTDRPRTFATLGTVAFDPKARVLYVVGAGGEPRARRCCRKPGCVRC